VNAFVCLLSSCLVLGAATAQAEPASKWTPAQQKGCDFLLKQQKDGVFSVKTQKGTSPDPGFTSLAIAALQSKPAKERTKEEQATIDNGLAWVVKGQNPDGSFGRQVQNYTTCAAVMALSRWEQQDKAKDALAKARHYVLGIQNAEASGSSKTDVEYGGVGYSKSERSDLSNVQFAVDALRRSGLPADHEALQRTLVFLQRTQNLKSVHDLSGKIHVKSDAAGEPALMTSGDDGGGVYYPGESPAGVDELPDGTRTPRSYGSMTYALLKTYTLCGVKADDPRVKAAVKWIGDNWTVTENPGASSKQPEKTKYQGLFYYYLLLAQALDTVGIDKVAAKGEGGKSTQVDWRAELRKQLESMQRADGSWLNERNDRFYENLDILCTTYALLALEHC
jgi:squalene-hopene/tetraprenyl-beta-curcumene cyclase